MLGVIERFVNNRDTMPELSDAEGVVTIDEHLRHRQKSLEAAVEAAAAMSKTGNVMPQISVGSVTYIADMLAGKNHVEVSPVAIRGVAFSPRPTLVTRIQHAYCHTFFLLNAEGTNLYASFLSILVMYRVAMRSPHAGQNNAP